MCRMILLNGNLEPYVEPLFSALKDVSRHDPLKTEFNGDPYQHLDGWGYVSMSRNSEIYARFPDPVFEAGDLHQANGLLLVHARRASVGEYKGIDYSHPFHLYDENYEYFLAHNGDFDKQKILKFMELNPADHISDTQAVFRLFMTGEGGPREKLETTLKTLNELNAVRVAANFMVVAKERSGSSAECLIYTDSALNKDYTQHSWLYRLESKGFVSFVSSSVVETDLVKSIADLKITRVPRGEIIAMPAGNLKGTNLL